MFPGSVIPLPLPIYCCGEDGTIGGGGGGDSLCDALGGLSLGQTLRNSRVLFSNIWTSPTIRTDSGSKVHIIPYVFHIYFICFSYYGDQIQLQPPQYKRCSNAWSTDKKDVSAFLSHSGSSVDTASCLSREALGV